MNNDLLMQKKFNDYVQQAIVKNQKISHAYLIEINEQDNYMSIIKNFVKVLLSIQYDESNEKMKEKISMQVDDEIYPDLKIIRPSGIFIKKEQLINLEKEFCKKSMLDNKLIYIIDKAEDLNDSSANTILKFLEEPYDNIIAILLTNNKYKVIETIVSRCQIISLTNVSADLINLDEKLTNFVLAIINKEDLIINFENYFNSLFLDKDISKKNLNLLVKYFGLCLNQKIVDNNQENLLINMEKDKIMKYADIFLKFSEKLNYNINLKLWLTDLLITVEGV